MFSDQTNTEYIKEDELYAKLSKLLAKNLDDDKTITEILKVIKDANF